MVTAAIGGTCVCTWSNRLQRPALRAAAEPARWTSGLLDWGSILGSEYSGFKEIQQGIDAFVAYLESKGVSISAQSRFASAVERGRQVVASWETRVIPEGFDTHTYLADFANLWWISSLIMRVKGTELEESLIPRLNLLTKADPLPLTSGVASIERNTFFEVIVACICSLFASNVQFDDPDVVCCYGGARWGIACKVVYGSNRETAKDVRKARKQIENSDVDFGLIAVQTTNRFPHERMYTVDWTTGDISSFHNEASQRVLFMKNLVALTTAIERETIKNLKIHRREWSSKARGIIFLASTVAYFRARRVIMGGCVFSPFSWLRATPEYAFVEKMNQYWQKL